jgi:hypothetical protein
MILRESSRISLFKVRKKDPVTFLRISELSKPLFEKLLKGILIKCHQVIMMI